MKTEVLRAVRMSRSSSQSLTYARSFRLQSTVTASENSASYSTPVINSDAHLPTLFWLNFGYSQFETSDAIRFRRRSPSPEHLVLIMIQTQFYMICTQRAQARMRGKQSNGVLTNDLNASKLLEVETGGDAEAWSRGQMTDLFNSLPNATFAARCNFASSFPSTNTLISLHLSAFPTERRVFLPSLV